MDKENSFMKTCTWYHIPRIEAQYLVRNAGQYLCEDGTSWIVVKHF